MFEKSHRFFTFRLRLFCRTNPQNFWLEVGWWIQLLQKTPNVCFLKSNPSSFGVSAAKDVGGCFLSCTFKPLRMAPFGPTAGHFIRSWVTTSHTGEPVEDFWGPRLGFAEKKFPKNQKKTPQFMGKMVVPLGWYP